MHENIFIVELKTSPKCMVHNYENKDLISYNGF